MIEHDLKRPAVLFDDFFEAAVRREIEAVAFASGDDG